MPSFIRNRYVIEWLALVLVIALLGLFVSSRLSAGKDLLIKTEIQRLDKQSRLFEANFVANLRTAVASLDYAHQYLPHWRLAQDSFAQANHELAAITGLLNGVHMIAISDQFGRITAASSGEFIGLNITNNQVLGPQFRRIREDSQKKNWIYVSPPQLDILNQTTIVLSKRIVNAQGEFTGLLSLWLEKDFFADLLAALDYIDDMQSFLAYGKDELFLMSSGGNIRSSALSSTEQKLFAQHAHDRSYTVQVTDEEIVIVRSLQPIDMFTDSYFTLLMSRRIEPTILPYLNNRRSYATALLMLFAFAAATLFFMQRRQKAMIHTRKIGEIEREQWLESLQKKKQQLNEAQHLAHVGSWRVDLLSEKVEWSDELFKLFELSPANCIPSHEAYFGVVHPEDLEQVQHALFSSASKREPLLLVYRLNMPSGNVKWVESRWATDFDANGQAVAWQGTVQDISLYIESEAKIRTLAFFDQLTGLPNRTLLLDRMSQRMAMNGRTTNYDGLMFIDMDNFKTINDTQGHAQGDQLLIRIANFLRETLRKEDTVARLGGDEFVVMLVGLSNVKEDAQAALESIAQKIRQQAIQYCQFGEHQVTLSIGTTLFKGNELSLESVLKQADIAMYKAKALGRNAVCVFDPAMESAIVQRAKLESDLKTALRESQFVVYYQLQVDVQGKKIGAESLLRWQHPQRGMVSPAEFIPVAEENGLMIPLGSWVIDQVCAQIAKWSKQTHMADLSIAVNVSASQFLQADFVEQVLNTVARHAISPQRIKLELTESIWIGNEHDIASKMNALKTKGIGFALDDFGTGYSSLAYLKYLPLDHLKIDQSFVRDIMIDDYDAEIARTVIALGQALNLAVIAEGVETTEQFDFLCRNGCHVFQGYLFSRPISAQQFELLINQEGQQFCPTTPAC